MIFFSTLMKNFYLNDVILHISPSLSRAVDEELPTSLNETMFIPTIEVHIPSLFYH